MSSNQRFASLPALFRVICRLACIFLWLSIRAGCLCPPSLHARLRPAYSALPLATLFDYRRAVFLGSAKTCNVPNSRWPPLGARPPASAACSLARNTVACPLRRTQEHCNRFTRILAPCPWSRFHSPTARPDGVAATGKPPSMGGKAVLCTFHGALYEWYSPCAIVPCTRHLVHAFLPYAAQCSRADVLCWLWVPA